MEHPFARNQLSEEKLSWLKEVGAKEFTRPMKWHIDGHHFYSEEYIKNTPLEELKKKYEGTVSKSLLSGLDYNVSFSEDELRRLKSRCKWLSNINLVLCAIIGSLIVTMVSRLME